MNYKIREAKLDDAQAIAKVHIKSWQETYKGVVERSYLKGLSLPERIVQWRERIKENSKDYWIFIAENEKGHIVGFISGGHSRDKKLRKDFEGELCAIYILKEHQNKKVGTLLIQRLWAAFVEHNILSVYVGVLKENPHKLFYMKHGARLISTTKIKIGNQNLVEEYYGWKSISLKD
jgi:ribosomal protein S18 acetylase RimI-like enzyme